MDKDKHLAVILEALSTGYRHVLHAQVSNMTRVTVVIAKNEVELCLHV